MNSKLALGFQVLTPLEQELILAFDQYNEYYFPEYFERKTGIYILKTIDTLVSKGLVIKNSPLKLTRSGKSIKSYLIKQYASVSPSSNS